MNLKRVNTKLYNNKLKKYVFQKFYILYELVLTNYKLFSYI